MADYYKVKMEPVTAGDGSEVNIADKLVAIAADEATTAGAATSIAAAVADLAFLRPSNALAYGKITTVNTGVIKDRGVTFSADNMDDTNTGTVTVTIPDGTRELRVRSDAAAGALTLWIDGNETTGNGVPISGAGAVDTIAMEFDASLGTNVLTLQFAAGLGAKYVEFLAFYRED